MGDISAVGASLCWAFTSFLFTISSRRVGSMVVNRTRLLVALILMSVIHLITNDGINVFSSGFERWSWLGLSGVFGLVLGDAFLFQAYALIGPRIPSLLMTVGPVVSTLLAWLFLGETLSIGEIIGINITIIGIAWVTLERGQAHAEYSKRELMLGILFGTLSSLCQAIGIILSKRGLMGGYSPLSGQLIRLIVSASVIWIYTAMGRQLGDTVVVFRDRSAAGLIVLGALIGPVTGVSLSLLSIQLIPVGIASTLMSLTPIFVLPLSGWLLRENISARAALGTLGAIAGVAVIFLAP